MIYKTAPRLSALILLLTLCPADGELEYTSGQILLKPAIIEQISRLTD